MLNIFEYIEKILGNYPQVVQLGSWASAIATLVAVGVSLHLAYRGRYSKVSAYLDIFRRYDHYDDAITEETPYKMIIILDVINHGPHTIFIDKLTGFSIRVPFTKHGYDSIILDFDKNRQEIVPGNRQSFQINPVDQAPERFFQNYFEELINLATDKRNKIKLIFPKFIFRYIGFYVHTSDGRRVKVKTSPEIRKCISSTVKKVLSRKRGGSHVS